MVVPRCPFCDSTTFAVIRDGLIDDALDRVERIAAAIRPELRLVACTTCGHSAWFHDPEPGETLRRVEHKIVHTGEEF